MSMFRLIISVAAVVFSTSLLSYGQVIIQIKPNAAPQTNQMNNYDEDSVVHAVFDPITDQLRLTPDQKFRIVVIATSTMANADSVFDQIDDLDAELSIAAFSGQLDEAKIKKVSDQEATLLSQVVALKARAKTAFYKVLTDEQRAMVVAQYRNHGVENIGSLSNLDR